MLKKLNLFFCMAAMMITHSVTANAIGIESVEIMAEEKRESLVNIEYVDAPIIQDIQRELNPKRIDTFFETETIPFETISLESEELPIGETELVSEGSDGELIVVKRVTTIGDDSTTEILAEKVVTEPVNEVIRQGTGENFIKTDEGYFKYLKKLDMRATAYCLCKSCTGKTPGQKGYGITASGMKARYGVVSVDPKVIPLGTELYIENYGYAIAGDTGKGVNGNKIDLFYDDKNFVDSFGIQPRTVYILDK